MGGICNTCNNKDKLKIMTIILNKQNSHDKVEYSRSFLVSP